MNPYSNIFVRFIMRFWQLRDSIARNPKKIILLNYGLANPNELPDAEQKCIQKAIEIALTTYAKILFTNSNISWEGSDDKEYELKTSLLKNSGVTNYFCAGISNNTIEELQALDACINRSDEVVLICDWMHARRARMIAKKNLKTKLINIITVKGVWNEKLNSSFQKSYGRWLASNIFHYLAYFFLGNKLSKLCQIKN
jgi:hypothetical protein